MKLEESNYIIDKAIAEIEKLRAERAELWAAIQDIWVAWGGPLDNLENTVEVAYAVVQRQLKP